MNLTQVHVAEPFCGAVAETESLHAVNSVMEPRRARREARGADFGDSARRETRVRASARLGQPCPTPGPVGPGAPIGTIPGRERGKGRRDGWREKGEMGKERNWNDNTICSRVNARMCV